MAEFMMVMAHKLADSRILPMTTQHYASTLQNTVMVFNSMIDYFVEEFKWFSSPQGKHLWSKYNSRLLTILQWYLQVNDLLTPPNMLP